MLFACVKDWDWPSSLASNLRLEVVFSMYFSSLESMLCKESMDRVECGPSSQCLCDCFSDNVIFKMALQVAAKVARIYRLLDIFRYLVY